MSAKVAVGRKVVKQARSQPVTKQIANGFSPSARSSCCIGVMLGVVPQMATLTPGAKVVVVAVLWNMVEVRNGKNYADHLANVVLIHSPPAEEFTGFSIKDLCIIGHVCAIVLPCSPGNLRPVLCFAFLAAISGSLKNG